MNTKEIKHRIANSMLVKHWKELLICFLCSLPQLLLVVLSNIDIKATLTAITIEIIFLHIASCAFCVFYFKTLYESSENIQKQKEMMKNRGKFKLVFFIILCETISMAVVLFMIFVKLLWFFDPHSFLGR